MKEMYEPRFVYPKEKLLTDKLKGEYIPPKTTKMMVETEGNFCGSIVRPDDGKKETITISPQEIGHTLNYDNTDPNTGEYIDGNGWDF